MKIFGVQMHTNKLCVAKIIHLSVEVVYAAGYTRNSCIICMRNWCINEHMIGVYLRMHEEVVRHHLVQEECVCLDLLILHKTHNFHVHNGAQNHV